MPEYFPDPAARQEAEFQQALRRSFGPEAAHARATALREAEFEERERLRVERHQKWEAALEKERREREKQREEDRLQRTAAAEADLRQRMEFNFLRQPGSTPEQFERLWPRLREEHQVRETLAATTGSLSEQIAAEMRAAGPADPTPRPGTPVMTESDT